MKALHLGSSTLLTRLDDRQRRAVCYTFLAADPTAEGGRKITDHLEPDPDRIQTREQFGTALTTLRLRADLTIRDLATQAGLPVATTGDYMTGRHLPGPGQNGQFRSLLKACGVTDVRHLDCWREALSRVRATTDGRQTGRGPDGAPYPGLRPFGPEDAGSFFGRDAFLSEVLARLAALRESTAPHLLFVVGASGSGKSSLLRAGVQPRVLAGALANGEQWSVVAMVPGADPLTAFEQAMAGTEEPRLLIVDQFEEIYALAGPEHNARFVAELTALGHGTLVVAGMRADFFPNAAADPLLVPALQDWQMVVPPLTGDELRSAITGPAAAWQVAVDDALVEVVLADVGPARRPGTAGYQNALPLLSHALLATWEQRSRGRLTLAHYRATGGLGEAVQQSAEQAYADLLPAEQELARRLFLRLVAIDDDFVTTKRRITRTELPGGGGPISPVLERFVARRLITVDEHHIEISHDALLTAWPRLARWITADAAGLRLHRRLTRAAADWQADNADAHLLMRGNLLSDAIDWAHDPDHRDAMNAVELDYLERSAAAHHAEQRSARERIRLLRRLVGALMVLVVVSAGLTGYAFQARNVAADQRVAADRARDEALSRQVAIESVRAREVDPALAEQLALAAYRISPTIDARSALFDTATDGVVHRLVGPSGPTMLRIDPTGRTAAISNALDGTVDLRRYPDGRLGERLAVVPAAGPAHTVFALAFSPDGGTMAIGGQSPAVRLIDVRDPARPQPLAVAPGAFTAVEALAFSPDGTRLVAGGEGPSLRAWAATAGTWRTPAALPIAGAGTEVVQAAAFSTDGRTLAVGGSSGALRFWPASRLDTPPSTLPTDGSPINAVAWSPDSRSILRGARDGTVAIVDAATRRVRARLATGFTSWVNAMSYAPRGDAIVVGGSNNTIALFDTRTNDRLTTIPSAAQVTAVAYAPGGAALHIAAADGTVRTFPARPRTINPGHGALFAIGLSRTGNRLAVASTGPDGTATLWSLAGPAPARMPLPARPPRFGPSAGSVAISPDGRMLATGNRAGTVLLTHDNRTTMLTGATKLIESIQFSPDGRALAASSDDGFVHRWDITDPARPRRLPPLDSGGLAASIAFSPDGRSLAAASVDHSVHRWDITDPRAARPLPPLTGFKNYAWSVAFSPDSRTLTAGSADDTIRLWDVSDPEHSQSKTPPLTGPTNYVFGVAFSPDGGHLAATGGDGSVWTWRLTKAGEAQPEAALHAANPNGKTYAVAYTPDGTTLTAVGTSGTVTSWPTDHTAVIEALCAGGGALTSREWSKYVPGTAYRKICP